MIETLSPDENLHHISYEAGILEDPNTTPPADMWKLTTSPENAPNVPETLSIEFKAGLPYKVVIGGSKTYTDAVEIFDVLNAIARKHGIGRIDIVENRYIGVKSRGCYESPGATILRAAHLDIEGLTLDRSVRALRDQFVTTAFSRILYDGYFFSPEREFITSAIPGSQRTVNGTVRLKLYKGNVIIEGRFSDEVFSLPSTYYLCLNTCRACMTNMNRRWMSWVVSNPPIPPASSNFNQSGLKSACSKCH